MLTNRDRLLIDMLVRKTRLATLHQVTVAWWGVSESAARNARRRIRALCAAGWLDSRTLLARPLLALSEPVCIWRPGNETPNFDRLAWRLQSRWTLPARRVPAMAASRHARRVFGGSGRRPFRNVCQFTHDLHVSAIYLHYCHRCPEVAAAWRGEDNLPSGWRGQAHPDALLIDDQSRVYRAIEFGGRYAANRLRHFHNDCCRRKLPYEVW